MDGGPVAATQPAAASGPSGASVQREQQAAFLEPSDQQPQQSQSQGERDAESLDHGAVTLELSLCSCIVLYDFADICRVCRCEATPDRPLFHPCICTGSIKYIHQVSFTETYGENLGKEVAFVHLLGMSASVAQVFKKGVLRALQSPVFLHAK